MFALIIVIFLSSTSYAYSDYQKRGFEIDYQKDQKKKSQYNLSLVSGKKDDLRFYQIEREEVFQHDIKSVFKSIINFDEKCNNEYKDRRKFINKTKHCKYHNSNLIESIIHKSHNKKFIKEDHEADRFLVTRRIYNRSEFSHIDLIKVFKYEIDGVSYMRITQEMLSDKEAKKYLKSPIRKQSAFKKTYGEYILTSVDGKSTKVSFTYSSETNHWLLNKSISVSEVFSNMAKSFDLLFQSIHTEAKVTSTTDFMPNIQSQNKVVN